MGGALGWLALILLWRRSGDFEWAADLICRGGAGLGWYVGYSVAGFWLGSFALSAVMGVMAAIVAALGWLFNGRRHPRSGS
jgi:hypothetical protein